MKEMIKIVLMSLFVIALPLHPDLALAGVTPWVDFQVRNGGVFVPITIAGESGYAKMDTGSSIHLINTKKIADKSRLGTGYKVTTTEIFGKNNEARPLFNKVAANLFGLDFEINSMLDSDLDENTIAVIGQPFFDEFVVQIDYPKNRMRLLDRNSIKLKKERNVEVRRNAYNELLVEVELEGEKKRLLMDTGTQSGILIGRQVAKQHNWLGMYPTTTGRSTRLDKVITTESFRIPTVKFGPFTIENVLVTVPGEGHQFAWDQDTTDFTGTRLKSLETEGLLGFDVIKHFLLTIDYKKGYLHVGLSE